MAPENPPEIADLVRALNHISRTICDIPSAVWESAAEADDPFWQALNEIDRIAFTAAVEANDQRLFAAIRRTQSDGEA